jgi:hypothetical protein
MERVLRKKYLWEIRAGMYGQRYYYCCCFLLLLWKNNSFILSKSWDFWRNRESPYLFLLNPISDIQVSNKAMGWGMLRGEGENAVVRNDEDGNAIVQNDELLQPE